MATQIDWMAAVEAECLAVGVPVSPDDPAKTLQDLIQFHVKTALDPEVSPDAQNLIDQGRAAAAPLHISQQVKHLVERARDARISHPRPNARDAVLAAKLRDAMALVEEVAKGPKPDLSQRAAALLKKPK